MVRQWGEEYLEFCQSQECDTPMFECCCCCLLIKKSANQTAKVYIRFRIYKQPFNWQRLDISFTILSVEEKKISDPLKSQESCRFATGTYDLF